MTSAVALAVMINTNSSCVTTVVGFQVDISACGPKRGEPIRGRAPRPMSERAQRMRAYRNALRVPRSASRDPCREGAASVSAGAGLGWYTDPAAVQVGLHAVTVRGTRR
jgi:hypothetical protein